MKLLRGGNNNSNASLIELLNRQRVQRHFHEGYLCRAKILPNTGIPEISLSRRDNNFDTCPRTRISGGNFTRRQPPLSADTEYARDNQKSPYSAKTSVPSDIFHYVYFTRHRRVVK